MKIRTEKGFFVLEKGEGPVYIVLHSGPDFGESGEARDTNADKIASLCWLKTGGSFLLSAMPRSRDIGIDLNRTPPEAGKAIAEMGKRDAVYMNRYGWWAQDKKDHENRLAIYRSFWNTAKSLGDRFFLLHSLSCRLANFPSIIDLITFGSEGCDREMVREIAERLNRKYAKFFSEISSTFKEHILFENRAHIRGTLSRRSWVQKEFFKKELDVISRLSDKSLYRGMQKNLNEKTFLKAAESALENGGGPRITVEEKFSGRKALGPKENLLGKGKALEIEINYFLSTYHAWKARDIILDIIKML